jgi:hypothetical protein
MQPGDVISYLEMCQEESAALQRGMNFHLCGDKSVILMSLRKGAPYADRVEEDGKILIYEGHDIPKKKGALNPKTIDQPFKNPSGSLTQNGLFFESATKFRNNQCKAEVVKVYEKIRAGIWVYNGLFRLTNAWQENSNARKVFKFKLELIDDDRLQQKHRNEAQNNLEHNRLIPTSVKLLVWKRDKGRCVKCGSQDNIHFDHIIPYSKGGSSLVAENIQLLCARHNIAKKANIE